MPLGKVRSFVPERGYGFIVPFAGGEDVFLHVNDVLADKHEVRAGIVVEFDIDAGDRGPKASGVRIRSRPSLAADRAIPVSASAETAPHTMDSWDGPLCDVLSTKEFRHELTEILLRIEPPLTAAQILAIRGQLTKMGMSYGWVEH